MRRLLDDPLSMRRCFDLARLGIGKVSPNPMVGSILVNDDMVIGEGYHKQYGNSHAEVNCFNSILPQNTPKTHESTLFVSLEPCCFKGKTPACSDLIIEKKVKNLRISSIDKTPKVNGKGLELLRAEKVAIKTDILKKQGDWFVRFRTVFVTKKRPFIILKYAISRDGYLGIPNKSVWLTNPISKRLVHKWRGEVDSIMIGTNTALTDNPKLDNRHFYGSNPLRIITDKSHKIPPNANLKDRSTPTWILGDSKSQPDSSPNLQYHSMPDGDEFLPTLFEKLVSKNIGTLMVEGGATLLQSFIDANYWDEARIFETDVVLGKGIPAPKLIGKNETVEMIGSDRLRFII